MKSSSEVSCPTFYKWPFGPISPQKIKQVIKLRMPLGIGGMPVLYYSFFFQKKSLKFVKKKLLPQGQKMTLPFNKQEATYYGKLALKAANILPFFGYF